MVKNIQVVLGSNYSLRIDYLGNKKMKFLFCHKFPIFVNPITKMPDEK